VDRLARERKEDAGGPIRGRQADEQLTIGID
jgi:hypothetical protein